jgi:8-oxo-dGTP diphosphatase
VSESSPALQSWRVGGAVLERTADDRLLLVRNIRRNGREDWTPPGGVIESHEDVVPGLAREVAEETGLQVTEWTGMIYEVHAVAPDLGWDLFVEVHLAAAWSGDLRTGDDPDGIVTGAEWADRSSAPELLASTQRWVREPLLEWLRERWAEPRRFRYRVAGTDLASMQVTRLD